MLLHGNWLVPHFEGAPDMWNSKPPLLIWSQAISMHFAGINEFAIRIPSALAAIITVMVLWKFAGKYFKNYWVGFLCGAVLATSMGYVQNHGGRTGDYDALLILFITLYCTSFFYWILQGREKNYLAFWIFLILAVLTKGIVGLMLLPGILLLAIIHKKILFTFKNKITWIGALIFILTIGGYYFGREQVNTGYLHAVYQNELGGRYLETLEDHKHPIGYYWDRMKESSYSYWFFWIFISFIAGFIQREKMTRVFSFFNLLLVLPFFFVVSFAGTKLEWYILPVFPFLALQIGWFIYFIWKKIRAFSQRIPKYVLAIVFLGLIFFYPVFLVQNHIHNFQEQPWDLEPHQPAYFLKDALEKKKNLNGLTIVYEGYTSQFQFYISAFKVKGQNIYLQQNAEHLKPGDRVLINQEIIKKSILEKYAVKILEEKFGCSMYLVSSRYE